MKSKPMSILFAAIAIFAFAACDPSQEQAVANAATALAQGAQAYTNGDKGTAISDAISGATLSIRALQGTPDAANPTAIQSVLKEANAFQVAAPVADAITAAVKAGVSGNVANESVMTALDKLLAGATPAQAGQAAAAIVSAK